ncbi:MAG TPA: mannitol-1-phosphate 5-dehydrogenase [Bacteroidales bacterium]|nr:mannitol-1-phosphate 5-dehydrogenase [Bacteroidales bacterium]
MRPIKNRSKVEIHKIVIFGAGKIGRSFVGQLFGCSGYNVVFIDVDQTVIGMLNQQGRYRIVIKGETEQEIIVRNVQAISAFNRESVVDAVSTAGIMAISVGKNALEKVIPVIAEALLKRSVNDPDKPLDIILAENMRSAAEFVDEQLKKVLPSEFPVDTYVGLIETSIGKMVPIMPLAELEKDPLVVFAEPYNTLILDGKGFKNPIPQVKGLAPKSNIKAWVDRKAFIHNLGHAAAAYYGYLLYPDAVYMYEVLDHKEVSDFTRDVMIQSADILRVVYPDDFTVSDLEDHIDDLIYRFRNKDLQDTIFRVGQDLIRKLGADDRFMGAIHLAMQCQLPYDRILKAMSFGLRFNVKDETGNSFPPDITFLSSVEKDFESTFTELLGFDPVLDLPVINKLKELYDLK